MKASRRLALEALEDRSVPATWGNPWPDAQHLTLSFAPDGTAVGPTTSSLYRLLGSRFSTAAWQRTILQAFQTWAVNANINIGLVGDNGAAFGSAGTLQGDDRYGDVRVGAIPMSPDVIALSSPFEATAGTFAGDVKFNSKYNFGTDGTDNWDLATVALHEAGHVFGFDVNDDMSSIMYRYYQSRGGSLSTADVAALQSLYGKRSPDKYEGSTGNDSFATAKYLGLSLDRLTNVSWAEAEGDITTLADKDYYTFTGLSLLGKASITLQTSGISLLNARVTVYDSLGRVVTSATATDPGKGDLRLTFNTGLLSKYYVKVESGTGDVFGIGSYKLTVNAAPLLSAAVNLLGSVNTSTLSPLLSNDLHTDDSFLSALGLNALVTGTDSRFDAAYRASLSDKWDVDYYKVAAPQSAPVLTAMVWGLESGGLLPKVSVYDASYRLVASEVLVNEAGNYIVQARNVTAGATYYVKVEANAPAPRNVGNYFLGVDFGKTPVVLDTFAAGSLTAAAPQQFRAVTVQQARIFHLTLSPSMAGGAASAVRVTFYNADGAEVFTLMAENGTTTTGNVFLTPGTYSVRIAGGMKDSTALSAALAYALKGTALDSPVGPYQQDPNAPSSSPPPPSGSTTSTQTSSQTSTQTATYDSSSSTTTAQYSSPSSTSSTYDSGGSTTTAQYSSTPSSTTSTYSNSGSTTTAQYSSQSSSTTSTYDSSTAQYSSQPSSQYSYYDSSNSTPWSDPPPPQQTATYSWYESPPPSKVQQSDPYSDPYQSY